MTKKKLTNSQKCTLDSLMKKKKSPSRKLGELKIIGNEMKKGKTFKEAVKRVKKGK